VQLVRISEHLKITPVSKLAGCFARLRTHEWIFNPFVSYDIFGSRFSGYWGFSGLIAVCWLGISGLMLISTQGPPTPWFEFFRPTDAAVKNVGWSDILSAGLGLVGILFNLLVFVGIGYGAMTVILNIPVEIATRLRPRYPGRAASFELMAKELKAAADAGIALGGVVLIVALAAATAIRWPATRPTTYLIY